MVFIKENVGQSRMEQLAGLVEKLNNKEITQDEYQQEANEINYYVAKETVGSTIVMVSVSLVYYVIMCYYCKGITLGKFFMKLKIDSANENELNIGNYLIRALFVNLILSNLTSIICVYSMSKDTFISVYPKISSVLSIFLLVTMLFMMYREDGRGLHDLMSNTKVISTKELKEEKPKDIVEEAKVIEEKQLADKKKERKKKEVKKK